MNVLRRSVLSAIILGFVGWGTPLVDAVAAEAPKTLKVTGSRWSPYVDEERPNNGLAADLVGTALRRAGYELDPQFESWPRAYRGVVVGIYDVVAAVWRTAQRDEELVFSEPYLLNDIIFLCRRGKGVQFENLEDLTGQRIGVVNEYAYGGGFDDYPRLNKVVNSALIQNILLLQQGKVDLVVGDQWSIFYEISQFLPDELTEFDVLERPLIRRGLRMGVSRQTPSHEKIVADFTKAMLEMNKDGTYREILQAHTKGIAIIAEGR